MGSTFTPDWMGSSDHEGVGRGASNICSVICRLRCTSLRALDEHLLGPPTMPKGPPPSVCTYCLYPLISTLLLARCISTICHDSWILGHAEMAGSTRPWERPRLVPVRACMRTGIDASHPRNFPASTRSRPIAHGATPEYLLHRQTRARLPFPSELFASPPPRGTSTASYSHAVKTSAARSTQRQVS